MAHEAMLMLPARPAALALDAKAIADACRRAGLRIVQGATLGWGKEELARWLRETYAPLAIRDVDSLPPSSGSSMTKDLSEDRIERMLGFMRADVLLVLREMMDHEGLDAFARDFVEQNLVLRVDDLEGAPCVVPRARSRMLLLDRVLSLFAVDALLRPGDYLDALFVCSRCDAPVFDRDGRETGNCMLHRSGIVGEEELGDRYRQSS
ncbi:hypothetical protein BH09MYX1_BH09MYX1_11910 [soil metagenome]